jgi:hypothetical protein
MDYEELAKRFNRIAIEHDELVTILRGVFASLDDEWRHSNESDADHLSVWAKYCRSKADEFRDRHKRKSRFTSA